MRLWELTTKRYHKDIGFPAGLAMPDHLHVLKYSRHACEEAGYQGVTVAMLPHTLYLGAEVVETSVLDGKPVKWVVRFALPTKPGWDIVIVLNPSYVVSTVWLNRTEDCHQTLKKYLYCVPDAPPRPRQAT